MPEKQQVIRALLADSEATLALGRQLNQTPELGFKEHQSAAAVSAYLAAAGLAHETGLSLTGIRATTGTGGYHIAITADMDAVSVSREGQSVPYHSCGHDIQMAVAASVYKALAQSGAVQRLGGRLSLILTPAEEFIDLDFRRELIDKGAIAYCSGKQDMIAGGVFDDVDCVLNLHITGNPDIKFDVGSTLAGFSVKKAVFHGRGAHSGALAYEGKNALHGANLFLNACMFLWEQFPPEAGIQLHPIITDGGISMNVIPEKAVVESYVRANTTEYLFDLQRRFDEAADHCAQALGLTCTIENTTGYMPLRQSAAINEVVYQNMRDLYADDKIIQGAVSGASGDVGDLSFLLPTVQIGFSGFEGRIHSDYLRVTDEKLCYLDTAQVLAATVVDLLANPALQAKNLNFADDKAFYMESWLGRK